MKSRLPKVLHQVAGKEMVRHVVDAVRETGPARLLLVVPPHATALKAALGDAVELVEQPRPRGTGDAMAQAAPALGTSTDAVLAMGADCPLISSATLRALLERHSASGATITLVTSSRCPTDGMGRILRDASGRVVAIVEEAEAGEEVRSISEINSAIYCFFAPWLWAHLPRLETRNNGEVYLTDLVALARQEGARIETVEPEEPLEVMGVNDRAQLAVAEQAMQRRLRQRWMRDGVTMLDPETTYIGAEVQLGQDTVILPNTAVSGSSRIGEECRIGPNATIRDSVVGRGCQVDASTLEEAVLEDGVHVGPYSHLRPGAYLESGVHLGNYAEVKNSRLGRGTHMGHFSYIGDATVGPGVNIGAGTITCNYDGVAKHQTIIEEGAFIGSDSLLVAPVRVGARARTGAGSVVTKDVPPGYLVVGVPARRVRRVPAPP